MTGFYKVIPQAKLCFWIDSLYGCNAVKWKKVKKSGRFVATNNLKNPSRILLIFAIIFYFILMSIHLGIILRDGTPDPIFGTNIPALQLWILVYSGISFGALSFSRDAEIAAWFNTLMKFEEKHFAGKE